MRSSLMKSFLMWIWPLDKWPCSLHPYGHDQQKGVHEIKGMVGMGGLIPEARCTLYLWSGGRKTAVSYVSAVCRQETLASHTDHVPVCLENMCDLSQTTPSVLPLSPSGDITVAMERVWVCIGWGMSQGTGLILWKAKPSILVSCLPIQWPAADLSLWNMALVTQISPLFTQGRLIEHQKLGLQPTINIG